MIRETAQDPDVTFDPLETFLEDSKSAGALRKMGFSEKHRFVAALEEESKERTQKFAKRFGAQDRAPADSTVLQKAAKVAAKVETVNGWRMEYDESGELIRAYEVNP
jgi:hypothetical protein